MLSTTLFILIYLTTTTTTVLTTSTTVSELSVLKDETICLKCPLIKDDYDSNIVSYWAAVDDDSKTEYFLCRQQSKNRTQTDMTAFINYSCHGNQLCLYQFRSTYATEYKCAVRDAIVKVNVNYYVQQQYISVLPDAEYLKIDGSKYTVKENTVLDVKCEVSETNPPSTVRLIVGNKEVAAHGEIISKPFEDRRKFIYSYKVDITRNLQNAHVICESSMNGIDEEVGRVLQIEPKISKKYTLEVQYSPSCGNDNVQYNTGYNQTLIMECKVGDANPNVTSYQLNGPINSIYIEPVFENGRATGKFRVKPKDRREFGRYECFLRNSVDTTRCSLNLILGGYPDPPFDCRMSYDRSSNKTRGQIDCKIGYNQNGTKLEFIVYERLTDGSLKHSGSVNIYESKTDTIGYLTKELDENDYYEFVVMQSNNYGDSEQVPISIGTRPAEKTSMSVSKNTLIGIIGGIAGALVLLCLCCCCCSSGVCSSPTTNESKSSATNCFEKYFPCCYSRSAGKSDQDAISYKKATYPDDLLHSYMDEEHYKEDANKYIPTESGLIYTPMLTKSLKLITENDDSTTQNSDDANDANMYKRPLNTYQQQQQQQNSSFRNELNYKLQKQRNNIEGSKVNSAATTTTDTQTPSPNGSGSGSGNQAVVDMNSKKLPSYETSSASSSTSNNDLLNSNNNLIKREKPPILKPKPRNLLSNYSTLHYSETPKSLLTTITTPASAATHLSSSPSTSVTDISASNACTPNHYDSCSNSDAAVTKYPIVPTRTNSLLRPKQRAPAPPPQPLPVLSSTGVSPPTQYVTTTFNRYIIKQISEISDNNGTTTTSVNYVNSNNATAAAANTNTLRRQNIIRNSEC